jgi:hypothetical protein
MSNQFFMLQTASNISQSAKSTAPKKKESSKLALWALKQIQER